MQPENLRGEFWGWRGKLGGRGQLWETGRSRKTPCKLKGDVEERGPKCSMTREWLNTEVQRPPKQCHLRAFASAVPLRHPGTPHFLCPLPCGTSHKLCCHLYILPSHPPTS